MPKPITSILNLLSTLSPIIVNLEPDSKEELTGIISLLEELKGEGENVHSPLFIRVTSGLGDYIGKLLNKEKQSLKPVYESVLLLKAIVRSLKNKKTFTFEIDEVMDMMEAPENPYSAELPPLVYDAVDSIVHLIVNIEHTATPELNELIHNLAIITEADAELYTPELAVVSCGLQGYVKKLINGESKDITPLAEGVLLLKAIVRSIKNKKTFTFDIIQVMGMLGDKKPFMENDSDPQEAPHPTVPRTATKGNVLGSVEHCEEEVVEDIEEEDIHILRDFVSEAKENLESIEINLVNLEESPKDKEIINDIFRPFHTIKGVSAFLDLKKINRLAHSTENLLDSAREDKLIITNEITDLILESVDLLKTLVQRVDEGISAGKSASNSDIDVDMLRERIRQVELAASGNPLRMGEILVRTGAVSQEDLNTGLEIQKRSPEKKLGEILVEKKKLKPRDVVSALRSQKNNRNSGDLQVKVETGKLDSLVDLTGELVIAQAILKQQSLSQGSMDPKLTQNFSQLAQIVSNIQKMAMSMRMVQIKTTFMKMVRLVRDLSRSTGKSVALEMTGEDTEIDRNVVDALYEPMVHMIRNAIDHGLETPEDRIKNGKSEKGTISLLAYHKGGNILIEIEDNGRGLNKKRILEKAISSGLISKDTEMSDAQVYDLVMQPGFSTAKEITDISGRGVGMDVVRSAIEKLRGSIDIRSEEGKGSCFTITLPLTLAIIDGMLLRVGKERYILPTLSIVESFRPSREEYFTVEGKGEMVLARGRLIPLMRLETICDVKSDAEKPWEGLVVMIEHKNEQRGLLIDEILGKDEFVIKSLGESFKTARGIAGGAILADGTVGLIFDIAGIIEAASCT